MLLALSFPLGWLERWVVATLLPVIQPGDGTLAISFEVISTLAGCVLNIYVMAAIIVYFFRKRRGAREMTLGKAEFRKLLDEHHKPGS